VTQAIWGHGMVLQYKILRNSDGHGMEKINEIKDMAW
jgi:hypothetical protein